MIVKFFDDGTRFEIESNGDGTYNGAHVAEGATIVTPNGERRDRTILHVADYTSLDAALDDASFHEDPIGYVRRAQGLEGRDAVSREPKPIGEVISELAESDPVIAEALER